MRYNQSIVAGTFDPLTQDDVDFLLLSANMCNHLAVIILDQPAVQSTELRKRYRWVYDTIKHFPSVRIIPVTDCEKAFGTEWILCHFPEIQKQAGERIDSVFVRNDESEKIWSAAVSGIPVVNLGPDMPAKMAPYALPRWVQPSFVKKVLISGVESTGKTTLAISLARHYNTVWEEETGRDISMRSGTNKWMIGEDNTDILLQTKTREAELLQQANNLIFIDTDCICTMFYLSFLDTPGRNENMALAEAIAKINKYDLVILLNHDVPSIQDGDRSDDISENKAFYTQQLRSLYETHNIPTVLVGGDYLNRYTQSIKLVDSLPD